MLCVAQLKRREVEVPQRIGSWRPDDERLRSDLHFLRDSLVESQNETFETVPDGTYTISGFYSCPSSVPKVHVLHFFLRASSGKDLHYETSIHEHLLPWVNELDSSITNSVTFNKGVMLGKNAETEEMGSGRLWIPAGFQLSGLRQDLFAAVGVNEKMFLEPKKRYAILKIEAGEYADRATAPTYKFIRLHLMEPRSERLPRGVFHTLTAYFSNECMPELWRMAEAFSALNEKIVEPKSAVPTIIKTSRVNDIIKALTPEEPMMRVGVKYVIDNVQANGDREIELNYHELRYHGVFMKLQGITGGAITAPDERRMVIAPGDQTYEDLSATALQVQKTVIIKAYAPICRRMEDSPGRSANELLRYFAGFAEARWDGGPVKVFTVDDDVYAGSLDYMRVPPKDIDTVPRFSCTRVDIRNVPGWQLDSDAVVDAFLGSVK